MKKYPYSYVDSFIDHARLRGYEHGCSMNITGHTWDGCKHTEDSLKLTTLHVIVGKLYSYVGMSKITVDMYYDLAVKYDEGFKLAREELMIRSLTT